MLNFTIFFTTDKMTSYDWCKIIVISVAVPMKSYVVLFTICHLNKLWKNCDLCYVHHIVVQRITNKITISLRLHLFRCKIFSIVKCFQMKMIFFFPCLVAFRKIFYSVVRKIEQKGRRVEACVFGKCFTKKLVVNHFPNFNKGFSGQRKLFFIWPTILQ